MFISLQATLSLLLDHLSLVASFSSFNRMTHQNLAVCFGPVLLTPTQEAWRAGGGGPKGGGKGLVLGEEITSAVDFKRHIEVLHYLLQLWPGKIQRETNSSTTNSTYFISIVITSCLSSSSVPTHRVPTDGCITPPPLCVTPQTHIPEPLGQEQHPALQLAQLQSPEEEAVVSRRGRGGIVRLESPPPINRYAGDWSICGRDLLSGQEADYDEVAGSESDTGK